MKLAVVTGTAKAYGIGRSISRSLLNNGYFVAGIDSLPAQDLENEHKNFKHRCKHYIIDVSQPQQVETIWPSIVGDFPSVDTLSCLVNNAAIADPAMPTDSIERIKQWNRVLGVNLTGKPS